MLFYDVYDTMKIECSGRVGGEMNEHTKRARLAAWKGDAEYMLMITLGDVYVTIITNYHFADTRDDARHRFGVGERFAGGNSRCLIFAGRET